MMILDQLASAQNRNDEEPNIELAKTLVSKRDHQGIEEVVAGLKMKKAIANDCIKVLYEIGERSPDLIATYVNEFLELLSSRNNRLVWGGMCALSWITLLRAKIIYEQIDKVREAYQKGSVITVDNAIIVFVELCKSNSQYEEELFPLLMTHLKRCQAKDLARHSEKITSCINENNKEIFLEILNKRKKELTIAQLKRIEKTIKNIAK